MIIAPIFSLSACNPLSIFYGKNGTDVDTNYHPGITSPPQITGIAPATGVFLGGTLVTISGSDFQSGVTVTLGGDACTYITVRSATQITCTTPAHAIGTVDLVVTNSDHQSASRSNAYAFVTAIAPAPGSALTSGGGAMATGAGVSMRATIGEPVKGTRPQSTGISLIPGATGISFQP